MLLLLALGSRACSGATGSDVVRTHPNGTSAASVDAASRAAPGADSEAGINETDAAATPSVIASATSLPFGDFQPRSEEEGQALEALLTPPAQLDALDGSKLVERVSAISLAHGYALCLCALGPENAQRDVEGNSRCARDEGGVASVIEPDEARCTTELLAALAGFDEYLRCAARNAERRGLWWLSKCSDPEAAPPALEDCDPSGSFAAEHGSCHLAVYCDDGVRVYGARCNTMLDCADQSDELDCFEREGHDVRACGADAVAEWRTVCDDFAGLCPDRGEIQCISPDEFSCDAGRVLSVESLCDREADCADGSDEAGCLRSSHPTTL